MDRINGSDWGDDHYDDFEDGDDAFDIHDCEDHLISTDLYDVKMCDVCGSLVDLNGDDGSV